MYVEGLDNLQGIPRGATALFLKIHHSVIDGRGAFALVQSFHNLTTEPGSPTLADTLELPKAEANDFGAPSILEKYGRAWWHSIERPIELAGTMVKLLPQIFPGSESGDHQASYSTPHSYFNRAVESSRVAGHVRLVITELNYLQKKHNCTINDIALCVIAGALRGYLSDKGALPTEAMRALMPIDIRTSTEENSIGNHVSVANVCLHTGESDVIARLRAINSDTSIAKKNSKRKRSMAMLELIDEVHPAIILWLGNWLVASGHISDLPDTVNTVVTNVPGILGDAFVGDAKLVDYLGFGPLAPNIGLFHTVTSVAEQVNISFLSTVELLGDGEDYRAWVAHSWEELLNT